MPAITKQDPRVHETQLVNGLPRVRHNWIWMGILRHDGKLTDLEAWCLIKNTHATTKGPVNPDKAITCAGCMSVIRPDEIWERFKDRELNEWDLDYLVAWRLDGTAMPELGRMICEAETA